MVAGFLSRVTVVDTDIDCLANIGLAFDGVQEARKGAAVTLDIDVYKNIDCDASDPTIVDVFEQLHDLKNRAFFSSITEEALRRYE